MSERIRLTITVQPEVHAVFQRMAQATGVSLGKCMGDWLGDTIEGAEFVAMKVEEARKAPKTVLREFQAITAGLHEELESQISQVGRRGRTQSGSEAGGRGAPINADGVVELIRQRSRAGVPPSSNTGGKSPRKTLGAQGRKGGRE